MASVEFQVPPDRVGRRRHVSVVATALAVALFLVYVALWLALPGSFRTGNDFAPTYLAGQFILHGHGSEIYREDRIITAERAAAVSNHQVDLPYISPPAAALAAAPLANLPFQTAETLYSIVQLLGIVAAAALVALKVAWPATAPPMLRVAVAAVAVGAPTVGALLLFGESDGLFTLAVTTGYLLMVRGHPLGAGIALGLAAGLGKPHLLIGVLAFLMFRRATAVVVGCIGTAALVNGVAVAVIGPAAALGFVSAVVHSGVDHAPSGLVGMAGLVASWLGNGVVVRVGGLAASLVVIALCCRLGAISRRRPAQTPALLAGAFALSLLGSPHLLVPDLVMVIPAFMWLYPELFSSHSPGWRITGPELLLVGSWAWLGVATIRDAANASLGFPGRLTPWGLMLFAFAAWVIATRGGQSERSPDATAQPSASGRTPGWVRGRAVPGASHAS